MQRGEQQPPVGEALGLDVAQAEDLVVHGSTTWPIGPGLQAISQRKPSGSAK